MSLTPRLDRLSENLIINGNFDFWQRNTSLVISAASSDKNYVADRWSHTSFFASGSKTVSRSTDVPAGTSATYSMNTAITSTISLAHATNNYHANAGVYRMEGLDALRIYGQTVTLQFWVKSTLTGLYSVAFGNNYDAASYKYVSTYTINAANTWEQKSITLVMTPAIVSNFAKDNTQGFFVAFGIAARVGSTRLTSSLNQWIGPSSDAVVASTANRTDFLTAGNSIRIAQVKLSIGSGVSDFSFAGRTYSDELTMCQRYYEKSYNLDIVPGTAAQTATAARQRTVTSTNDAEGPNIFFRATKRALPVKACYNDSTGTINQIRNVSLPAETYTEDSSIIGVNSFTTHYAGGSLATGNVIAFHWTADAEL